MIKKVLQYAFLLGVLCFLALSLVRAAFFPKEINEYENRYANQIEAFSLRGFLSGSFQQSVEEALPDQVLLSQSFKKMYNTGTSAFVKTLSGPILKALPDRYVVWGDKLLFGGENILFWPRTLESQQEALDAKAENLNSVFAAHPEVHFYMYFIEKDTDINFETGERTLAYDYLCEKLNLPAENTGCFRVENFAQFNEWFYRTDHHWNAAGSLEGYRQLMSMLKLGEPTLMPIEEVRLDGSFTGSKATGILDSFSESMTVYRYDFPMMTVTREGVPDEDYGAQAQYLAGMGGELSYGNFYGHDDGETVLDTGTEGRGRLLILGESYDNAILKLIASHYDCTYAVDLRYYEPMLGEAFDLDAYLAEHEIDSVLLIGNIDYFVAKEFMLGGAGHGIQ